MGLCSGLMKRLVAISLGLIFFLGLTPPSAALEATSSVSSAIDDAGIFCTEPALESVRLEGVLSDSRLEHLTATATQSQAVRDELVGRSSAGFEDTEAKGGVQLSVALPAAANVGGFIDETTVSIVGRIDQPDPLVERIAVEQSSICGDIKTELLEDGQSGWVTIGSNLVFTILPPWAFDERGFELPTHYELDSAGNLVQVIETLEAQGSITFDPSYTAVNCIYGSAGSAMFYLNTTPLDSPPWCPVRGMFTAANENGYFPVWGYQQSLVNAFGKIIVRQDGSCTGISGINPGIYNFELPCRAHDYCYDLRRAAFSGTVTDQDCDDAFAAMLTTECNSQPNPQSVALCKSAATLATLAVNVPWVVTNQNPGIVEIRNANTGQCADIEGPSTNNNAPIQQWGCVGVTNQRFKIWEAPGAPGYFQIQPIHSGKCARALNNPIQYECKNWNSMRFRIQGALNQNMYSIRSKHHPNECWKVPLTYSFGADLIDPACNDFNGWYLWRIVDVS